MPENKLPLLNEEQEIDEFIRRSVPMDVPSELRERMQSRLLEFRTKVEKRRPGSLRRWMTLAPATPAFRLGFVAVAAVAVVVLALVVLPTGPRPTRVYAAAAQELRSAHSLQYTVEFAPGATVDFSYAAPTYRRVFCSWGIEVRSDGSGKELVLMHLTHNYVIGSGNKSANEETSDLVEQFRAMPATPESFIGEQQIAGKKLLGYRVHTGAKEAAAPNQETAFDIWIDPATSDPDHIDISVKVPGKPAYQMHVKDIRVNSAVDSAQFDMTPPTDYTQIATASSDKQAQGSEAFELRPEIVRAGSQSAVVLPMKGEFSQARFAVSAVQSRLNEMGVSATGPAFGRFPSEASWDAGLPVPSGTVVTAPFQAIAMPESTVARVFVKGPWGQGSSQRWTAFLKWVLEHGYVPDGPATEIWNGADKVPNEQITEMRIVVKKAR